ncbi:NmrA/HSCARG family protein [Symbioplanes lichenis]|uniref:NmrA/HSCARG family protein n=1 Tax=Symbioplanes lichenis TaxID=1629072 RepID=UPI002739D40D|nr:NmrA/HSCARG family protein [Actinoplanes lichenis]
MTTLVIGATGNQGGATARALLAADRPVRALVRDPGAPKARELAAHGAELVTGDLDDRASVESAVAGVTSVFSVAVLSLADAGTSAERDRGLRLVDVARAAGLEQFVHTSVSGAGAFHRSVPGYGTGRWNDHYWDSKAAIDEAVRDAGFAHWTVLRPATFMENLLGWSPMFGDWAADGVFVTSYAADTALSWIAVDDIGAVAAAAIIEPGRLDGQELELAAELLTMTQLAATLTDVLGRPVTAPVLSTEEALARGMAPYMVQAMDHLDAAGQPARPEHAAALGFALTGLRTWATRTLRPGPHQPRSARTSE